MTKNTNVPNRLINEKSPYLLQHAHNPVNWYPWGNEAFKKAEAEKKPVFLSIGYSTCHWCHVMERESFEDEEVAQLLNSSFIAIKVDREERPDVDHLYMSVCQALTGHGGWPLSVFLTPEKKPFYAGTYFPKHDRLGMHGFISILESIRQAWESRRDALYESSEKITREIMELGNAQRLSEEQEPEAFEDEATSWHKLLENGYLSFMQHYDAVHGGFGSAPKFPTPHNLMFLMRYYKHAKEPHALEMVEKTLDHMYKGGIYDHIGYGFSRYSTDRKWLVPHFEKMLYDNALLAITYLEAFQLTHQRKYGTIAEEILTYVLRDMTHEDGGFYSAEDADSEGEEGKFYVWTPDEIRHALGSEEARKFCSFYDITSKGNFEGFSIPNLINNYLPYEAINTIKEARKKLFHYREERIHPFKDDKILTSWNGLMIAAMAMAGRILGNKDFLKAAQKSANFIFGRLRDKKTGRLLSRFRDGDAAIAAYGDDYAFLIWGLLELYASTFDSVYLKHAVSLNEELVDHFWDDEEGGLYLYADDAEQLFLRPKDIYDGATPSANSVSALNWIRLSRLTGNTEHEERAQKLLQYFQNTIELYPAGHSFGLMSLLYLLADSKEVVIVTDKNKKQSEKTRNMIEILYNEFRPFTASLLMRTGDHELLEIAPYLTDYPPVKESTAAYICENFSCMPPVTDLDNFSSSLRS